MLEKHYSLDVGTESDQLNLFSSILNTMDQSVVGIDCEGTIICFNHGSESLFGYKKADILGQNIDVLFSTGAENNRSITALISNSVTTGDRKYDWAGIRQNKSTFQTQVKISSLNVKKTKFFAVFVDDISDQLNTKDQIYNLYGLMNQMGSMAKVGGWELDIATNNVTMTDSLYDVFELEKNTAVQLAMGLEFYIEESKERLANAIERAIQYGEPYRLDLQIQTHRGAQKWVETYGEPVLKNGKVHLLRGSLQEITQFVEAERTIKKQKEQAEFVARFASRLNTEFSLSSVLNAVCEEISKALNVKLVAVSLYDSLQNKFVPAMVYGLHMDIHSDFILWTREQVALMEQDSRLGTIVIDLDKSDIDEDKSRKLKALGARKIATALLYYKEELIGGIHAVIDEEHNDFSDDDLKLLRLLGDQSSPAIVNAQLYSKAQEQIKRIESLRSIDTAIANSYDVRLTLRTVIDVVISQLKVDAADVLLYRPVSNTLDFAAGSGFITSAMNKGKLRLGEGISGRAVIERRRIHIPNLAEAKQAFVRTPLYEAENFVTFMVVPLIAKGQIKGALEIFHRTSLQFDDDWLNYFETVAGQAAIAIDSSQAFEELQRANLDLSLAYDNTIEGWSRAMDLRDKETEGHTQRVTEMTMRMAEAFGMREEELVHVRRGALLHDIGKLGVPDYILLKPGKLSDEEWKIMRQHTLFAYEMLNSISYLRPALDIPYCHHEKWDGSGYPRGLKGEEIPMVARLFAVVDVWDALSSDRPYREGWPQEKVFEYIREQSGSHFDPRAVEVFFQVMNEIDE